MGKVLIVAIRANKNIINDRGTLEAKIPNTFGIVEVSLHESGISMVADKADLICVKTGAMMPFGEKRLSIDIYKYMCQYWTLAQYIVEERCY